MSRNWVVTGAGALTALGDGAAAIFDALLRRTPVAAARHGRVLAARMNGFEPREYLQRKRLGLLSRTSQLACSAASRLGESLRDLPGESVGIVLGTAWASLDTVVRFEREAHTEGPRLVDPILFTETVANVAAGHASIFFGWSALNATVCAGTGSGLEALRRAVDFLGEDRASVVVAGGADEMNEHLLRALSEDGRVARERGSMPWTPPYPGPVPGEGAALIAVEDERHAASRGAEVLGRWLAGVGSYVDPQTPLSRLLCQLLERAELSAADVDLVVLSANGTLGRDRAEAEAVREVFGDRSAAVLLPKAVLGETWAAAGPLGLLAALESMRRSIVPGCPDAVAPGPEIAGPALTRDAVERRVRRAVVLDCAESGLVSAIAVAAAEAAA